MCGRHHWGDDLVIAQRTLFWIVNNFSFRNYSVWSVPEFRSNLKVQITGVFMPAAEGGDKSGGGPRFKPENRPWRNEVHYSMEP